MRASDFSLRKSRVLSAPVLGAGRPFLWDAPCGAPHATNPDGEAGMPLRSLRGAAVPIRSCSRWGLPCRPCCQGRGALLPHRFALACGVPPGVARRSLRGRFVFCGTVPGVAPAGGWPAPYSRGARTFLCRPPCQAWAVAAAVRTISKIRFRGLRRRRRHSSTGIFYCSIFRMHLSQLVSIKFWLFNTLHFLIYTF